MCICKYLTKFKKYKLCNNCFEKYVLTIATSTIYKHPTGYIILYLSLSILDLNLKK